MAQLLFAESASATPAEAVAVGVADDDVSDDVADVVADDVLDAVPAPVPSLLPLAFALVHCGGGGLSACRTKNFCQVNSILNSLRYITLHRVALHCTQVGRTRTRPSAGAIRYGLWL